MKASKFKIMKKDVEFLGQQICRGGMTPIEVKLKAIQDWATPKDIKGGQFFLGFVNYYRWFVKDFATIADPFISLLVLLLPNHTLPCTIVIDASGIAAGGVLMQNQGNGLQFLTFLSSGVKPMEQRYSEYEWELAAVAYCLQSWQHSWRDVLEV